MIENADEFLTSLHLERGEHADGQEAYCVMEAVAYIAGEPHSDHPACASKVIAAFLRRWNDDLDEEGRQALKPLIVRLVGTAGSESLESRRAWLITDWMVRVYTPAWLDLGGMPMQAAALRNLKEFSSTAAAQSQQPTLDAAGAAARDAAWAAAGAAAWAAAWDAARDAAGAAARAAAWAAAWAAAGDAAGDAARAAAWAAARDAAGDAARAAAWAAARAAAWDAAWDAARAKLKPTVESLQKSAFNLLDRLIEMREENE